MLALFTEEQEMLREMAGKLAESVGLVNPDDLHTVDRAAGWRNLAESGLLALRTREADGTPAATGVEVMVVAEALGGALAPLPFVATAAAAELLALVGAPADWLDEVAAGDARYGLLLTADLAGLADLERPGDLDGALAWDVDGAAHVLARSGGQVVRLPVGDTWTPVDAADLTRTVLDPGGQVGTPEPAGALDAEAEQRWLALALTLVSADAAGAMRVALQRAVDYAKERVQYGVLIGTFQAIQHLLAETFVQVEAAQSAVRYAAWGVDELPPDEALLAARTAKAHVAGVSRDVTETVMQVFGGIGQTWEHIAHVYTRRALFDRQLLGDGPVHLDAIADSRLARLQGA